MLSAYARLDDSIGCLRLFGSQPEQESVAHVGIGQSIADSGSRNTVVEWIFMLFICTSGLWLIILGNKQSLIPL